MASRTHPTPILFISDGWVGWEYAKNDFQIYRAAYPYGITMTGSAVDLQLSIPFPHIINKIMLYETDSSYAESQTALSMRILRDEILPFPYFTEYLLENTDIDVIPWTEVFGEQFRYPPTTWDIRLIGTATRVAFLIFDVHRLSEP